MSNNSVEDREARTAPTADGSSTPSSAVLELRTLALGFVVLLSICTGWEAVGFSPLVSDAAGYAKWSHDLVGRSGGWHLPGYPLLIATARVLTLHLVPDLPLMVGLSFIAWTIGVITMGQILKDVAADLRSLGVLVYALFPLVGITNVAQPIADTTAQSLFLVAFYATVTNRQWIFIGACALGMSVHMVLWPFMFALSVYWVVRRRLTLWHVLLSGVPLSFYYIYIAVAGGDWLWFLRMHYRVNFTSSASVPLFDAVFGSLREGSVQALLKSGIVSSVVVGALLLLAVTWRRHDRIMWVILMPLLLFAATVNAAEAFVVVRYAGLGVIPLFSWVSVTSPRSRMWNTQLCLWVVTIMLVITQWVWAAYTVSFFSS